MEEKIKQKLTEYLGFNYTEIINNDIDQAFIYGGAIRDIIANQKIHDIDILCLIKSMGKIQKVLEKNGYTKEDEWTKTDINELYGDIKCICYPITYMKYIDGEIRKVQLIRSHQNIHASNEINLYNLLTEVDMSCCGVHFSHKHGLKESIPNALLDIKRMKYRYLQYNTMSDPTRNNRYYRRKFKLEDRGWEEIKINKKLEERYKKIHRIIDEKDYYLDYSKLFPKAKISSKKDIDYDDLPF